jgi:hypothetical protein
MPPFTRRRRYYCQPLLATRRCRLPRHATIAAIAAARHMLLRAEYWR